MGNFQKFAWLFICLFLSSNLKAYDDNEIPLEKKDFSMVYFSPLKTPRDHSLHATLFQPYLMSATALDFNTGILGVSFDYTDLETDFKEESFSLDYTGNAYRLNLQIELSIRDLMEIWLKYNIIGLDGNDFSLDANGGLLKSNVKKTVSGNIELVFKQQVYTWQSLDLGVFLGVSIPVDKSKSLLVSRKFDFGGGVLATWQQELFAVHFNAAFIFTDDPTGYEKSADFNHNFYSGLGFSVKMLEDLYLILQGTLENQALGVSDAPEGIIGQGNLSWILAGKMNRG